MMAIPKSDYFLTQNGVFTPECTEARAAGPRLIILAAALLLLLGLTTGSTGNASSAKEIAIANAQKAYADWQARWQQNPTNTEFAWQFARACFDCADFAQDNSERARFADQGIAACHHALAQNPQLGPAHYFLALNLGQRARTDKIAALKIIRQMETEFKAAIRLSPNFDYAGPDRSLGLLYQDAPGWPIGIGSHHKSLEHLRKSVQIAPQYPDNWLSLLETYLKSGDRQKAFACLKTAQEHIDAARQQLTGEQWQYAWELWNQRWERVKIRTTSKVLESPRTSGP